MSAVVDRLQDSAPQPAPWLQVVARRWAEVTADPSLANLPYKIETNRTGQIVMSPARTERSVFQAQLTAAIDRALGPFVLTECAIGTRDGVKVADVAWCRPESFAAIRGEGVLARAPELCVDVRSPSNAGPELLEKVRLYLDSGAQEVWIVAADGSIAVHGAQGLINASALVSPMPKLVQP